MTTFVRVFALASFVLLFSFSSKAEHSQLKSNYSDSLQNIVRSVEDSYRATSVRHTTRTSGRRTKVTGYNTTGEIVFFEKTKYSRSGTAHRAFRGYRHQTVGDSKVSVKAFALKIIGHHIVYAIAQNDSRYPRLRIVSNRILL